MELWVRNLAKIKWLVVIVWLIITVGSVFVLPDLQQIVRNTESKFVPSDAQSAQASAILEQMDPEHKSKSNAVVVLQRETGLTEEDHAWFKKELRQINANKEKLGLVSTMSAYDDPTLAEKFISQDKTTEMAIIEFPKEVQSAVTADSIALLKEELGDNPSGTTIDYTGSAPIFADYNKSSEEGLKKTEVLTIVLVLSILLIVFRSPIAPFIPLVTIGIAFVLTRGLVALSTKAGLPVSSFTETFLIAVLFGAGTDYCILLIHRYREELSKTTDRVLALTRTIMTVGKTVIYSGSTVLIAFFLIGFAKFGLYQSAVGVAIGMAVTLLAAVTLTPALMLILGPAMYWPVKLKAGHSHGDSKLWGAMARLTSKRPLAVLLVCVLLLSPFIFLFQGNRSFDDLAEIDPDISAVKGFRKVEAAFSSGEVLPVSVAITSATDMRSPEGLAALEKASAAASLAPHVKEVRSAARPLGKQIQELTVPNQLEQTNKGLEELRSGVNQVRDGFRQAQADMNAKSADITKLQEGAEQVSQKLLEVQGGLKQVSGGLASSQTGTTQISDAVKQLTQTASSLDNDLTKLVQENPELAQSVTYQTIVAKQKGIAGGLNQTAEGLLPLSKGLAQLTPAANSLTEGVGLLADGQSQVSGGIKQLQQGLDQFGSGLGQGTAALSKVSDGLTQVVDAQKGIAENSSKQIAGWYVPKQLLEQEDFKKSMDFYISKDGRIAKLEVVLSINPYSKEAMNGTEDLKETIQDSLAGTALTNVDVKLAGTTPQAHELDRISQDDFIRTGSLVLIGIYIVLALLLRSLVMPLYLLLSLGFNYLITMGIVEFIFVKLLGYDGLSWTVSFFVFLVIVALGVDYNIFLMARFKEEYRHGHVTQAMSKAMTTTGGVIMSAAVIMGGTFGALMFSGMNTLLQLGAGIVIGLAVYTTVIMGLVVPSLTVLFGESNWWPFNRARTVSAQSKQTEDQQPSMQSIDAT
ncbi:MMPL family transporter [Paenibacillus sedimenti]|uniref:MMPL family transporter n=1 Tax=Paenibacillus sedimenti TaxID=2770274 RepID=A0A926QL98_9BACL|nr:MMPL family transporter [Paenibacillus sedimenti]MBD0383380.1 MMPL family transporter [Paenibacillus sedimenti]